MLTLQIKERNKEDNNFKLRKEGEMPAVFYGPKEEAKTISVKLTDFLSAWKEAGESSVIILKGVGEDHEAIIHDVDVDPVSGNPRHADFYIIEKGKKVKVSVPLEFVGVSNAVKDLGGTLVKVLYELEIEAMPKDLPQEVEVDISKLETMDDQISAGDVKLPEGVTLLTDPEDVVASVAEAMKEEEVVEPADISSIEVEKKGKEAKEGEEGAGEESPKDE